MKIFKILIIIIAFAVALFVLFLAIGTAFEYRPPASAALSPLHGNEAVHESPGGLQLLSWNIGYCGLDDQTDFFLEGGSQKNRKSLDSHRETLDDIIAVIEKQEPDICFLQEVDIKSRRSYKIDQSGILASKFDSYEQYFGKNYGALFVPIPVQAPIGKVESGVLTMSRYASTEAVRHSLPGSYSWPVKIFHLKRCALVTVIPSPEKDRSWYLVNAHLSAYDNGSMRAQQLEYLKSFITEKYDEGHYVVVGGDWNSLFPGVTKEQFGSWTTPEEHLFWIQHIPAGWTPPDWQWCYDAEIPTVRSLEQPFADGENFTTIIDGFLVSPNLRVDQVRGFDLGFKSADHNPVSVTVSIRD